MTWTDLQRLFDRAIFLTMNLKKLLFAFCVLVLAGLVVVFFRGMAVEAGSWATQSLTFMAIFLCAGIVMAGGIVLTRVYHDEVKRKPVSYRQIVMRSWYLQVGAAYFTVPIILAYIVLWTLLGFFSLLNSLPGIGGFFAVVLAPAPFLIHLGAVLLCALTVGVLFYVTPIVALRGINHMRVSRLLLERIKTDVLSNLAMLLLASAPLLLIFALLSIAAELTGSAGFTSHDPLQNVLQWFFIMLPYVALVSPGVVFFFNFAAEAHVHFQSHLRHEEGSPI